MLDVGRDAPAVAPTEAAERPGATPDPAGDAPEGGGAAGVVALPAGVVWIDLLNPTRDEELAVERMLGVEVPTREEMANIEESARLYVEAGTLVMTAAIIDGVTEGRPRRAEVTFLLARDHLVTVRYTDPVPFRTFPARVAKFPEDNASAPALFTSLIESFTERMADVLEVISADLDRASTSIFGEDGEQGSPPPDTPVRADLRGIIRTLGRRNRMLAVLRESLHSFSRLLPFLRQGGGDWMKNGAGARLKAVERDLKSLTAYEAQLEQQISFLHEATISLINLEQNAIIKVFSVAAVLFLPPTLVGTIYGMNFDFMPELDWRFGYPVALVIMVVSAIVPYLWFKRRGWL